MKEETINGVPYRRIRVEELDTQGVVSLIGMVIQQAVKDYRYALKSENPKRLKECERFFTGRYFEMLTSLDGTALMRDIRKDIIDAKKKIPNKRRSVYTVPKDK